MEEAVFVKECEARGYLIEDRLDLIFGECSIALLGPSVHFVEIALEVIENQEQLGLGQNDLSQFDYIRVLQFLQTFDLSKHIAVLLGLVFTLHLLDSHHLVIRIDSLINNPKGTVSDRFNNLVLLHFNYIKNIINKKWAKTFILKEWDDGQQ